MCLAGQLHGMGKSAVDLGGAQGRRLSYRGTQAQVIERKLVIAQGNGRCLALVLAWQVQGEKGKTLAMRRRRRDMRSDSWRILSRGTDFGEYSR